MTFEIISSISFILLFGATLFTEYRIRKLVEVQKKLEKVQKEQVDIILQQLARITEMWNVEKRWDMGYQDRFKEIEKVLEEHKNKPGWK